ncbi:IclR helix-turn-helix domain-containing protein [Halogranum amylolyticum]|uniref:IclR helix-turn-helix domain-containing protein n=1 Tax=Halogranum amylolyticum TaxID=660520 RepID=A0A1H8W4H9_9EURY|nr:helix-turn-helix domain-containing protein [Halogranum amylolyticum]SEP22367.1 IclR helix-turn-helix domain-containing protein [Halogranum amylolyticum]
MHIRTRAAVLAALVLIVSLVAAPVAAATAQLGAVTVEGDAVVQTDANETYLWQSEPFSVNTSFATDTDGVYQFCLEAQSENGSERLSCQSQSVEEGTTTSVSFTVQNVSDTELAGETQLNVSASESFNSSSATVNRSVSVYVITKDGDFDDDGLENRVEVRYGSEMNGTDTDGDGLQDGPEIREYETDPTDNDSDGDGLLDSRELQIGTDPTNPDTDGDGLTDGEEINEFETDPKETDTDGDGLPDGKEVQQHGTDPTDPDTDGDGLRDDREVVQGTVPNDEADSDEDGLDDTEEVKHGTNASKADTDGDFLSDSTEVRLGTDPTDPTTPLVLLAGLGFLVVGLVGFLRVFGPDDVRTWVAERDVVSRVATLSATDAATNGSDVSTSDGSSTTSTSPASVGSAESTTSTAPAAGDGSMETTDAEAADDELPFDLSDPLTDEDEVLKLLYEADGRLRQSEINNSTEWSKSKVSRLLSRMEDEGKIRKITIGRENLVTLADRVPQSAESPFDEDDS